MAECFLCAGREFVKEAGVDFCVNCGSPVATIGVAEAVAKYGVTPDANEAARSRKSAADSAAFEAAERLYGENARVNDALAKRGE